MFLTVMAAIAAAMLLEGAEGDDAAWDRVKDRFAKLIDERVDAAFDRWLEKGKPSGDPPKAGDDPPKPADPPTPAPVVDPPTPARKAGILEVLGFGGRPS